MATLSNLPQYPKDSCSTCVDSNSYFNSNLSKVDLNAPSLTSVKVKHPDQNLPSLTQVYKYQTTPNYFARNGKHIINNTMGVHRATDFKNYSEQDKYNNIACKYNIPPSLSTPDPSKKEYYVSMDPRLRYNALGEMVPLDAPPYSGDIPIQYIYQDPKLIRYGQGNDYGQYKDYANINTGQIQYYTSTQLSNPLFNPIFEIESTLERGYFKDPMDNVTPQYKRRANTIHNRNISGYQFDRDQIEFREDLISKQLQSGRYRSDYQMNYGQQ